MTYQTEQEIITNAPFTLCEVDGVAVTARALPMRRGMEWMRDCGARLPKTHGVVCLNSLRVTEPCAALDFQPALIGARAVELVIGQLLHNELGIPVQPSLTTIPARFVEGPTLRAAAAG